MLNASNSNARPIYLLSGQRGHCFSELYSFVQCNKRSSTFIFLMHVKRQINESIINFSRIVCACAVIMKRYFLGVFVISLLFQQI